MANNIREMQGALKPIKGMVRDTAPINQPANSYRFALNMMLESREGDYSSLVNEEGTSVCHTFIDNQVVLGTQDISNKDTLIFHRDKEGTKSYISTLSVDCVLTEVISSTCLNFYNNKAIQTEFRIKNGCERIVYFTDGTNPYRTINLDALLQYTDEVTTALANTNDTWKCERFDLFPAFEEPCILLDSVVSGGGALLTGTYQFAIRYLDTDLNATAWSPLTEPIPIYIAPSTSGWAAIDGGADEQVQADFKTNKSIRLDLSNLDQSFVYYQISVVETVSRTLVDSSAYIMPPKILTASTATYTYRGNTDAESAGTVTEIVVPGITIKTAQTHAQIDNRLVLGNVTQAEYDWGLLQRASNTIDSEWYDRDKQFANKTVGDNTKSPNYYFFKRSYFRDEIYAFGIVFKFKDGSSSPAFHIPGREILPVAATLDYGLGDAVTLGNTNTHKRNPVPALGLWDTQLVEIWNFGVVVYDNTTMVPIEDTLHLGITNNTIDLGYGIGPNSFSLYPRWKIFNTAINYELVATNQEGRGLMGYHELETKYPPVKDCVGNYIFPRNIANTDMANIRHHRFPDSMITNHFIGGVETDDINNGDQIVLMGVVFDTTAAYAMLPLNLQSRIQGHYFVRAVRTDDDKTVIDNGIKAGLAFDNSSSPFAWTPGLSTGGTFDHDNVWVVTPKVLYEGAYYGNNNYIKIGRNQTDTHVLAGTVGPDTFDNTYFKYNGMEPTSSILYPAGDVDRFRVPTTSYYVEPDTTTPGGPGEFWNTFTTTPVLWMNLSYPSASAGNQEIRYITIKQVAEPYNNLQLLTYVPVSTCMESETDFANDLNPVYGGDAFITRFVYTTAHFNTSRAVPFDNKHFIHIHHVESEINCNLRSHVVDENGCGKHYDYNYRAQLSRDPASSEWLDHLLNECADNMESFLYNPDFSKARDQAPYFPLELNYSYCRDCIGDFPHRIWYSERSYQEDTRDNYRKFLANNYRDILPNGGPITNMFVYKDNLYTQTNTATWFVPTRPQQLKTNEGTLYVGTGDLLAVPPKRLETVDRGYGGNQDPEAEVVTEFGAIWPDRDAGKIFLFGGQLNEISAEGLRNWFSENMPFEGGVDTQIPEFNSEDPTTTDGIGYLATFDPRHNRYIITKKYYRIKDAAYLASLVITDGFIFGTVNGYNTDHSCFYTYIGGSPIVQAISKDVTKVEEMSWTMSYSLPAKAWISYHSYKPQAYWHTRSDMLSFNDETNIIAKHNSRNYGFFYDTRYPSVVDYVMSSKPFFTDVSNCIDIIQRSYEWVKDDLREVQLDTFNHIYVYNNRQSSGILDIEIKDSVDLTDPFISVHNTYDKILADWNEGNWNMSGYYDMAVDYSLPVLLTDQDDPVYAPLKIDQGYIYYPNTNRSSITKNPFEIEHFRDKWMGVWLTYDNTDNYKLVIDYLNSSQNISFK